MENFRKSFEIEGNFPQISYASEVVLLGSCFTSNVGDKIKDARMDPLINPLGVIFNPMTIGKLLLGQLNSDLLENDGYWFSWDANSSFNALSKEELVLKLDQVKQKLKLSLDQADPIVFITLGTAWIYELKATNDLVGNCHKMPQDHFSKRLLDIEEIVALWKEILLIYSSVQFVFTISPVRHWKDGVRENNVSKGVLHLAVDQLIKMPNVSYFPSYEIVMDELRDYRFYDRDYLHPSEEAVDYIWQRMKQCFFDENTMKLMNSVQQLEAAKRHKIMFPASSASQKFIEQLQINEKQINEKIERARSGDHEF